MAYVFISHASDDKPTARLLAHELAQRGHQPWLDEWEIKVGESIPLLIEQGIARADYVLLLLTEKSVSSPWVEREWRSKFWDQIKVNKAFVLPCLIENCEIPTLLHGIKYADFTKSFTTGLATLLGAIDPMTAKPIVEVDPLGGRVTRLIAKVNEMSHPLSACVAEGLAIARELSDESLESFCRAELTGEYPLAVKSTEKTDPAALIPWRVTQGYVVLSGTLNTANPLFETTTGVFSYMANDSEHFKPIRFVMSQPLSKLEQDVRERTSKSIAIAISARVGEFLDDAPNPDWKVTVYLRPESAESVVAAVRVQFIQRLLKLMPVLSRTKVSE